MKETEYIIATNRVKVSMALDILGHVFHGEAQMVEEEEFRKIVSQLRKLEDRLFKETLSLTLC